jgi:hypothetical protein
MTAIESWLRSVLSAVSTDECKEFSGLGFVFYTNRAALPVYPLVAAEPELHLPARTLPEAISLVGRISKHTSIYHDGFHLVDATSRFITDVSQFLSPPIAPLPWSDGPSRGARHMAARLTSVIPAVSVTAVCTRPSDVTLYESGNERTIKLHP